MSRQQILDYSLYLHSDRWRRARMKAFKRALFRCQVCNSRGQLNAHHRTYENLGCEKIGDLTVLCRDCHELFERNGRLVRQ